MPRTVPKSKKNHNQNYLFCFAVLFPNKNILEPGFSHLSFQQLLQMLYFSQCIQFLPHPSKTLRCYIGRQRTICPNHHTSGTCFPHDFFRFRLNLLTAP